MATLAVRIGPLLLCAVGAVRAQDPNDGWARPDTLPGVPPGIGSDRTDLRTKQVVPLPTIREADVMWARRVWREIDLREKINLPLYYPEEPTRDRKSLFDVIRQALLTDGSITAYDPGATGGDDEFKKPLTAAEVRAILGRSDTTYTESITTGEMEQAITQVDIGSADIRKYRIKEDWVFDRQRSVMDIRIIGIAPLQEMHGSDGEVRGYRPLFWLYFPELRYVLVNADVFDRENDAERRSFDHVFLTRQFSSTIVKVSNVYDRGIITYQQGIDALLAGQATERELFEFEHDLWHY